MKWQRRPWLYEMAAAELATREKHYPAMIAKGEIVRDDAESDLAAWRAIAGLMDKGETRSTLSWAELEHAAARNLQRRNEAAEASPGIESLANRLLAAEAVHSRIADTRRFLDDLNATLRARAARERIAA